MKERIEKERLEQVRLEQEKLEKARLEKDRLEQQRLEKERLEQERIEQEQLQLKQREKAIQEKERLAMERIGREQEKLRLKREKLKHQKQLLKQQNLVAKKLENEKQLGSDDLAEMPNQALENQPGKPQTSKTDNKKTESLTANKKIQANIDAKQDEKNKKEDWGNLKHQSVNHAIDDVIYDSGEELEKPPESRGVELFVEEKLDNNLDNSEVQYFVPEKHMISWFLHQLEIAKQTYQLIEIKFNGILIIIDQTLNTIYCNCALDSKKFSEQCSTIAEPGIFEIRELAYDEVKTHQSFRRERPELSHSIESFIWATSLHTSQGRIREHTDTAKVIGLKRSVDFNQFAKAPYMNEIIGLLEAGSNSLAEIQKQLGIPYESIFDIYNALLNLGLIEFNLGAEEVKKQSKVKVDGEPKKIFGGFFKRKRK